MRHAYMTDNGEKLVKLQNVLLTHSYHADTYLPYTVLTSYNSTDWQYSSGYTSKSVQIIK